MKLTTSASGGCHVAARVSRGHVAGLLQHARPTADVCNRRVHPHAAAQARRRLVRTLRPQQLVPAQAQASPQQDGGDGTAGAGDSSSGPQQEQASQQQQQAGEAAAAAAAAGAPSSSSSSEPSPASSDAATQAAAAATPPVAAADGGSSASSGGADTAASAPGAAVGGLGSGGSGGGPSAVTLLTRFNGVGYTFVLAGFLKIVTLGGLASSAPTGMARTALGAASPYLMVPVGLGMAWVAKQVVDSGLHEDKRFMRYLVGVLVLLYFGLVKLMYRYEPSGEWVRRPRPRMPGQMSQLRADLGDRELLAGASDMDISRSYQPERPGRELYDDVAWYEGRYPSQLAGPAGKRARRGSERMSSGRAALAATDTDYEGGGGGVLEAEPSIAINKPGSGGRRSFLSDNHR